jgi:hypothetical protein
MTIIPAAALESHIGILGKTGSGKSNAAKVIAEQLMHAGKRVCALDPTGTWWGLRLSHNGKAASNLIPVIFGGDHSDIPISRQHGAVLGEAIGTSADSAIIDTQQMKVGERVEFATEFAEALLRANRGPLHLIVDEAHLFAPQGKVNDPQSGKMVHAFNNLVSLGRGRGLRIILISQRPAKLHKDSLTQVETLVAMRLIAPQDRAAIRDWVGEWADKTKGDEIIASLPSLPVGDAWVWAPQLDYLERKHFPLAATYDSGTAQANAAARELPSIDLAQIGAKMDTIRQQAMENDPKRLKAQIIELQNALSKQPKAENIEAELQLRFDQGRAEGFGDGYLKGYNDGFGAVQDAARKFVADIDDMPSPIIPHAKPATQVKPAPKSTAAPIVHKAAKAPQIVARTNGFSGPQLKVLTALSMWKTLGHDAPTKPMVAMCAGYSHSSGGFGNLLSQLNTAGAIEYPQAGKIRLLASVGDGDATEARAALLGKLTNPQRKIVDALHSGGEMSKTDLGAATEYSPTSGGFGNLLSQLRSLGLIDYPSTGRIALEPWLEEIL